MNVNTIFKIAFVVILFSSFSFAETTCSRTNCDLTITIKLAFSGANDSYISSAQNEIESVWNGPDGYHYIGDCNCKLTIKVETKKITNPAQVNCNPGPPGYHCVMVTDYNNNPPRNQTNWTGAQFYIGYMYGIATGNGNNSQNGWWSNIMSRPIDSSNPSGGHYLDFAHEAGHLMGLDHNNNPNSIMNNTVNTSATQEDAENAAKAVCGENACPDFCCCGNGKLEKDKGEGCDPFAFPDGCSAGESCCFVCCQCYKPMCLPVNGEFIDFQSCQGACGSDATCYLNYKTGCWDCVKHNIVITGTCLDPTVIKGNFDCDHQNISIIGIIVDVYNQNFAYSDSPISGMLSNERINFETFEGDKGHVITQDGKIIEYGAEMLPNPTVTISTDRETLGTIAEGKMSVSNAIMQGRIKIEAHDFMGSVKFGFYNFLIWIYGFFEQPIDAQQ
ncbi:SCP2 sterol-binding domain-containing protein [Candidatus Micrarchaeota archaeon]|nr:SCP2 sterol-binding domain-containing protein [Candidatus Micrarchaeota archaeon]